LEDFQKQKDRLSCIDGEQNHKQKQQRKLKSSILPQINTYKCDSGRYTLDT